MDKLDINNKKNIKINEKNNKAYLSADKFNSKKNKFNISNDKPIKTSKKKLDFFQNNKTECKSVKKFSQKNKMIFRELLKRTLINKGDKELLLMKCLKKDPQIRTKDDIYTIKNFLSHTQLTNALLNIPFFEQKNCDNFLTSISLELKIKFFKEEQSLFQIGEKADNFYIIYNGNIQIENIESYKIELSCRQYIKSIIDKYQKIYDYKDKYLINTNNDLLDFKKIIYEEESKNYSTFIFEKIIESNKHYVDIEENEIPLLNLILLMIDIKNLFNNIRGNYDILLLLIQDYEYDYKQILKGLEYLQNNFFVHNVEFNMRQIYKNIPEINNDLIEKYEEILGKKGNYDFIYFRKGKNFWLQKMGECFGDITNELKFNTNNINEKRNYSASTAEKSVLAYISFERFNELLQIEKEDIKNSETKYLKSSFFFYGINNYTFMKKYLKCFIYEESQYNNFLFTEGQKDKYVYFLKYGKYEIFCMKNVKKICQMITTISNNYLNISKRAEYIKLTREILKNAYWGNFIIKEFLKDMKIKLFVLNKNFVLGLEALYNDIPYLYNVKILSDKCGYYKIEYKYLLQLMKEIKNGNEILINENDYLLELILERLVNVCHKKVKYISNERKINLDFADNSYKIKRKNKGKIKTKVITNKIKEYLNNNKRINSDKKCKKIDLGFTQKEEENHLTRNKNKDKLYFLTELSNTKENTISENSKNKIDDRILLNINSLGLNIKDKNFKAFKINSFFLNHKYSSSNNTHKRHKFLEQNSKKKKDNLSLNKSPEYNPIQIKFEENLSKQIQKTLDNELLFYSFRNGKYFRKIKTAKLDSKLDLKSKDKKLINEINNNNDLEKDKRVNDKEYPPGKVILPYYNSSRNIHKNNEYFNIPTLKLNTIKKRNSTRNKTSNIFPLDLPTDVKYTFSNHGTYMIDMKNSTVNNFKIAILNKYNNDEEKNDSYNKNKTISEIKNRLKGYQKFNGNKNSELKMNIESYSFKGKKYTTHYNNFYNKKIYKSIKERVEDNLFMNGQSAYPKINNAYY